MRDGLPGNERCVFVGLKLRTSASQDNNGEQRQSNPTNLENHPLSGDIRRNFLREPVYAVRLTSGNVFFFKQKTAYEIGLGIPAEPLFRSNMLGTFVKDWFRYESHFVHGRDSLVDILKERGLLSESDAVQPLIGKKS